MTFIVLLAIFALVPSAALVAALRLARSREKAIRALRASEEKFARIFQTSPDAINLASQDQGICLDLNDSYVNLFGYTREEVIGRSVLPSGLGIWVDAADRERFLAALKGDGRVVGFEAPLRRKDGSVFTALVSSTVMEVQGRPCNLSLTRDISGRKLVEEALREAAQRLELALQAGSLGLWDRNLRDGTMIWNDRMYEMYGLDPATFVPTNVTWLERVLSEDRAELQERIPRALREPGPHHVGFRTRLPSGEVRHLSGSFVVVRDSDGQPFRMIGVVRDRTEQVQAEAEHRRLQEERQHSEKLESLGSLAGGMAHDMNNVLAGILGTAELLRQSCADASPTARSLDSILHAAGRGRDLVRALTDFARKGLAQTQEIDLNDLLRKEVELLRHATPQKVQVLLDLDPLLPKVLGDPSALGGTFMNLGVNALDAMPDGGTLSFRTRAQGAGRIEVRVVDTGVGMAPEVLVRAMEPFFTTKPAGKGTGLGLARVYGTVKAHGGTVQILSAPGQGTAIVIQLPGYREPQAPAPEPAERAEPRGPLRVLLVDDDPILLESIPPLLESRGHRVTAVPRGEEALTLLEQGLEVDLVVLDHNMPGLTGAETLVKIRECRPGLPVILATGFVDGSTEAVVAGLPGVRVLNKPYRMEELCQALAAEAAAS